MGVSRQLARVLRQCLWTVRSKVDPVAFARSVGVDLGERVHFYGCKPGMFGTEPWLIRIGSDVHITSGCQFITHDGATLVLRHREPTLEITAPITIGNRVYLGVNTTILPGVTIGDDVVVGAGAVVTRDIPSNSVAVGVPARVVKSLDDFFEQALSRSLELGHLEGAEKDAALRRYFGRG